MARSASSISAWDICSKSRCCSTSRSETVKVASTSTSGGSSSSFGASPRAGLQRLLQAAAQLLALVLLGGHADLGQQHLHHLFEKPRIAPVDVERLVEDLALVAAVHEHRMERPVEIVALLQSRRLDRLDRAQHLPRPDPRPAVRKVRAKCTMLVASLPPRGPAGVSGSVSITPPRRQTPSPPARSVGGEGGARAQRGRVRWAAAPASEPSRACRAPPHLPVASQRVPSSPPLRGGEDHDERQSHARPSPAAGRRCRTSPCAGSRPLPSPAGAGCRPGTSAARPTCR